MKIPRLTVITFGVTDLSRATKFYDAVHGELKFRVNA